MTWCGTLQFTTINKQGAKSNYLKTIGHDNCKVSVWLTAKADGTKLKPFVVFRAVKRESKSLGEEFEYCCVVKSSVNA